MRRIHIQAFLPWLGAFRSFGVLYMRPSEVRLGLKRAGVRVSGIEHLDIDTTELWTVCKSKRRFHDSH